MLQFVWPVIVFWYLAFSLPKGQKVRESDTDETQWFLSQWKCDNGERKMTLLIETDRFTLGWGPGVAIGPVWAPRVSLGPEWWVTWSRSICLNAEYVHYTSEAELCQCLVAVGLRSSLSSWCVWIPHYVGDCWSEAIHIPIDLYPTACVNLMGRRPLSLVAHVSQKCVIRTGCLNHWGEKNWDLPFDYIAKC